MDAQSRMRYRSVRAATPWSMMTQSVLRRRSNNPRARHVPDSRLEREKKAKDALHSQGECLAFRYPTCWASGKDLFAHVCKVIPGEHHAAFGHGLCGAYIVAGRATPLFSSVLPCRVPLREPSAVARVQLSAFAHCVSASSGNCVRACWGRNRSALALWRTVRKPLEPRST